MIKGIENSQNNIDYSDEENFGLLKIFNYIKKKANKVKKKISTDDINDLREQNSDNESDKTNYEKKFKYTTPRKTKSVISNNSNSSNSSSNSNNSNLKRTNSYNIIRDSESDDYTVKMNYQKYIMKKNNKYKI